MATVCLTMIVKNEAHVLARCLRSVRRMIHCYVIVDTGSEDRTKEVIARELAGIPGKVIDRPWKDFSTNRNQALEEASGRADYNLVIDADDELQGSLPSSLSHDFYTMTVREDQGDRTLAYERVHLFRSEMAFQYEYVLHEQLRIPKGATGDRLPRLTYRRHFDGARSAGDLKAKWLRDAEVCRTGFAMAAADSAAAEHYSRYYAQSLQAAGETAEALAAFRANVGVSTRGKHAIVPRWQSLFQIALLSAALAEPEADVLDGFLRAYELVPSRLEPLYELAGYLQEKGRHRLAYTLLKPRANQPPPEIDGFSIEYAVYQWALKDRLAVSAFYVGDTHLARRLCEELLATTELPESERARVTEHYTRAVAGELPEGVQAAEGQARVVTAGGIDRALIPSAMDASSLNAAPATPFFGDLLKEFRRQLAPGSGEMALSMTLFALVVSIRAKHVLELGRYKGATTFAIASALKLLTEEPWEEPAWAKVQGAARDYPSFEAVGGVRKVYSVDPKPMPEAVEILGRYDLKKYATFFNKALVEREELLAAPDVVVLNHGHPEGALPKAIGMLRPGGYLVVYDVAGADARGRYIADEVTKVLGWPAVTIESGYRGLKVFRKTEG
jgi:hypothetical protein